MNELKENVFDLFIKRTENPKPKKNFVKYITLIYVYCLINKNSLHSKSVSQLKYSINWSQ